MWIVTGMAPMRRGFAAMCFSRRKERPVRSIPSRSPTMAIRVSMQAPSEAAARSVGENELPSPLLSTGAAVRITVPEGPWVISVFRLPMYLPVISTAMTILPCRESNPRPL